MSRHARNAPAEGGSQRPALIQRLHPALRPGSCLTLWKSGNRLFSSQGDWDSGSALHCVTMALAMLGVLSDPVAIRSYESGPVAHFWDQAWPHYLHGLTLTELANFIWELNVEVQPVLNEGELDELLAFCEQELAEGWPVIVGLTDPDSGERHAALVVGIEERPSQDTPRPQALLLLDPAGAEPGLAACNARLEAGARLLHVTAQASTWAEIDGAISIRSLGGRANGAGCV